MSVRARALHHVDQPVNRHNPWDNLVGPPAWMAEGICATIDPDFWFPERGKWTQSAEAQAICHTCPVREQCLDYAVEHKERWGVWGGVSSTKRRKMIAERFGPDWEKELDEELEDEAA